MLRLERRLRVLRELHISRPTALNVAPSQVVVVQRADPLPNIIWRVLEQLQCAIRVQDERIRDLPGGRLL